MRISGVDPRAQALFSPMGKTHRDTSTQRPNGRYAVGSYVWPHIEAEVQPTLIKQGITMRFDFHDAHRIVQFPGSLLGDILDLAQIKRGDINFASKKSVYGGLTDLYAEMAAMQCLTASAGPYTHIARDRIYKLRENSRRAWLHAVCQGYPFDENAAEDDVMPEFGIVGGDSLGVISPSYHVFVAIDTSYDLAFDPSVTLQANSAHQSENLIALIRAIYADHPDVECRVRVVLPGIGYHLCRDVEAAVGATIASNTLSVPVLV